tara:strand:+ start:35575 stop:35772 length:198 start_codon:yes stop_codon:yes gene_type:complete
MVDKDIVEVEEVKSPCVSICALDMDDVCVGCHRTGDEITQWWAMSQAEKLATLEKVKQREKNAHI